MRTLAVLPVKPFQRAKRRLRSGLADELRESLVEAMLTDVLDALSRTSVHNVLVITAGAGARRIAERHGARVLADEEAGHNAAAELGVSVALRQEVPRVLLVPGDCPALDPTEIDELLERSSPGASVLVVPDRHGTGTNALLLTPPDAIPPSFGPGSCARHLELARSRGVSAEVVSVPSLALDVDTPRDLEALVRSGAQARHTLETLARC